MDFRKTTAFNALEQFQAEKEVPVTVVEKRGSVFNYPENVSQEEKGPQPKKCHNVFLPVTNIHDIRDW